eukprot:12299516-Alexandrium_andersonii.AAC.1
MSVGPGPLTRAKETWAWLQLTIFPRWRRCSQGWLPLRPRRPAVFWGCLSCTDANAARLNGESSSCAAHQ